MSSDDTPQGYSLIKCVRESSHSKVLLASRDSDGREVVLKAYHGDLNRGGQSLRAKREFDALRAIAGSGVPEALDLVMDRTPPVLVLGRIPGIAVVEWIPHGGARVTDFLTLATQLSDALARVHAKRMIHRDISPDNVLIEPSTLRAYLIDFGLSRLIGAVTTADEDQPQSMAGTLAYIAPEQTGRMNRGIDTRSDLYSLGATLYQVITGRRAFASDDALELIHAHIARVPPDPVALRPGLPRAVGDIVLKLMRKDPEERYQTARALHADLNACLDQLAQTGEIDPHFVLGESEAPDRPRFPAKLYGREREALQMQDLFRRCSAGERSVGLILRAEAGSGKSALVNELRTAVAASHGHLVTGKFEPQRVRPYAGWIGALESLAQQLLLESNERLERWRRELLASLGNIAHALVDLVPDLQFILGEVPPVPSLGSRETQARLSFALQRFIAACASNEQPLVLFLDDLQWSDAGSCFLIEELLVKGPRGLFLIGALAPSETADVQMLTATIDRLTSSALVEVLELEPLGASAVLAMLADTFGQTPEATVTLAELIRRKTGNSPLLVRQFVEHIHERGLLRYESGRWKWELSEIAAADIPDGAVALMSAKIHRLETAPRFALMLGSCIGDEFNIELLCDIGGGERAELERGVHALCDEGLIAACANGFRFVHDRIREIGESLLDPDAYERLQYRAGSLLLARTADSDLPQHVFTIVEHLKRGRAHLSKDLEMRTIELNVQAGRLALSSGAHARASGYFAFARELFTEPCWSSHWKLGVDLYLQSAEAALQARDYDGGLQMLVALEARPLSRMERTRCAATRIRMLALSRGPREGVQYMLSVLREHGIRWPLNPSRLHARLALLSASLYLRIFGTVRMQKPAAPSEEDWRAVLLITTVAGPLQMRHDLRLACLSTALTVRRYIRHGYVSSPSFFLSAFAAYRFMLIGGTPRVRDLTRMSYDWNRAIPNPIFSPRADHVIHALVYPWLMRRRQALAPMDRVAEAAREVGDQEFTYYSPFLTMILLALGGESIPSTQRKLASLVDSVKRYGHWFEEPRECQRVYEVLALADPVAVGTQITELDARFATEHGRTQHYASTLWLLALCVYRRYDLAFAQSEARMDQLGRTMAGVHVADFVFYRGLAAAALVRVSTGWEKRRCERAFRKSLRWLREWARMGPDFVHMTLLLEAEQARIRRQDERARALYEKAAQRALAQAFPHHAAIASELRADLLSTLRRETEAAAAVIQAAKIYQEWGAPAKVAELSVKRRDLLGT